eukprot:7647078-Pyramimonas_sp.AAC.1
MSLSAKVTHYANAASDWARANRGMEGLGGADSLNQLALLAKGLQGMHLSTADSGAREAASLEAPTVLNDMLCGSATNAYSASVAEFKEVATIANACKAMLSHLGDERLQLLFVVLFTENLDLTESMQ